jgi:hypothetical protein
MLTRAYQSAVEFNVQVFMYCAWFRDNQLNPDEQDHEWVAMFLVAAESSAAAQHWGDHLAHSFALRNSHEEFIRSYVEPPSKYEGCRGHVPHIEFGSEATDEHIGW